MNSKIVDSAKELDALLEAEEAEEAKTEEAEEAKTEEAEEAKTEEAEAKTEEAEETKETKVEETKETKVETDENTETIRAAALDISHIPALKASVESRKEWVGIGETTVMGYAFTTFRKGEDKVEFRPNSEDEGWKRYKAAESPGHVVKVYLGTGEKAVMYWANLAGDFPAIGEKVCLDYAKNKNNVNFPYLRARYNGTKFMEVDEN